MPDLEQQLAELSTAIAWPQTPDLRARVLPAGHRSAAAQWVLPRWALAAAAVLVLVAVALAYTPTRNAIANFVNLHTAVQKVRNVPTPSPAPGHSLNLGQPAPLAAAQGRLAWKLAVPAALGAPDAVYLQPPGVGPSGGEVSLVYTARPGIPVSGETGVAVLVTEARGTVNEQFFGKILGPGTTIESVTVNGHAGWWISGRPHEFFMTDQNGNVVTETLRLATNTLLIDDGGTIVRIEGDLTKDQALQIAGSL